MNDRNRIERQLIPVLTRLLRDVASLAVKSDLVNIAARIPGMPAGPFIDELRRLAPEIEAADPEQTTAGLSAEAVSRLLIEMKSKGFNARTLGWKLGQAIRLTSTSSDFEDVKQLLADRRLGRARQMLPYVFTKERSDYSTEAADYLMRFIDDQEITLQIVDALATLKAVNAVPMIRKCEDSSDPAVRRMARKAIKKIEASRRGPRMSQRSTEPTGEEISSTFEIEDLQFLLIQLGAFADEVPAKAKDILSEAELMEIGEERTFNFHTREKPTRPLDLHIFKDDEDAIDVAIVVPPDLKESIRRRMTVFGE